jgi:hypothetical protein
MIEEHIRAKITELVREADQLSLGTTGNARNTARFSACESWIVQAHNATRFAVPIYDNPYRTRIDKLAGNHSAGIVRAVTSIAQNFKSTVAGY